VVPAMIERPGEMYVTLSKVLRREKFRKKRRWGPK